MGRQAFDETFHPCQLVGVVECAIERVGIVGGAEACLARGLHQPPYEFVMNGTCHQHTGGCGAILTGVEVPGHGDMGDGLV